MKGTAEALPGLEEIKVRFLALLEERKSVIAHHTLAAWEATDPNKVRYHLETAQNILHQIAGSAGSMGFDALGKAARDGENEIISHFEGVERNDARFPVEIISRTDAFVSLSQALLTENA